MGMPVDALGIDDYRTRAVEAALRVAAELERRGVEVVVTGSLARGRFDLNSDRAFLHRKNNSSGFNQHPGSKGRRRTGPNGGLDGAWYADLPRDHPPRYAR